MFASILSSTGARAYFIGIKGTGMCALAELLHAGGLRVSGSDCADVFYTDAILKELGIPYFESFDSGHITDNIDLVIHSAAYSFETNPEMAEARRLGLPLVKYTDALGAYSTLFDSSGIAGVHGKTTTTALCGALVKGINLPARVLVGSAVSAFGRVSAMQRETAGARSTLINGDRYFIAETCEYRRHFLSFCPKRIVLTSVESDHQDYYPTYEAIRDAFLEYGRKLPSGGELIYCADDAGAAELAATLDAEKRGIRLVPYGFKAEGDFRISAYRVADERTLMRLAGFSGGETVGSTAEIALRVPGRHTALNAAAALALCSSLINAEGGAKGGWTNEAWNAALRALDEFRGSKRRSEIIGEAGGILFMDDYGHHPTAIQITLEGLREFYPKRRIVVSFMSHTYTRTAALLDRFAASLTGADIVFLHKIYASAREVYEGGVNGKTLFERTQALFPPEKCHNVYYIEEYAAAVESLKAILRPADLFLTLGAGDNWKLGQTLFTYYQQRQKPCL
ncbi:MAG: UDP-N-acetylmuramate--L-alanine ligase [Treponema sp.]|jgi:UDP-N-acetylmuramate--alanine ligase|nr:UDP-N-acetylmuramate--L-alanine ligase [Treponema sp.]